MYIQENFLTFLPELFLPVSGHNAWHTTGIQYVSTERMNVQKDNPTPSSQGGANFPCVLRPGRSHCFPEGDA